MSTSSMQNLDRFISLPDYVRDHILSFLSMEDAAKTSVLSRQWRNSCSSLSNLKFVQKKFEGKKSGSGSFQQRKQFRKKMEFRNFVDHLLIQHDQTDIRSFDLSMCIDRIVASDDHIKAWILFAIVHNVQELYLNVESGKLTYSFFTCSSLKLLSLSNLIVELAVKIFLPNLNTLKLSYVKFCDQDVAENLFSSCPVLQYLTLKECSLIHGNTFTISASKLRHINYTGDKMPNISSETLSSLKDVTFFTYDVDKDLATYFLPDLPVYSDKGNGNVLRGLHNVETLTLGGNYIKILHTVPGSFSSRSNSCCSLKHLDLYIWPLKGHFELVIDMLRAYSNLESLRITFKGSWLYKYERGLQQQPEVLTGSLLMHLKGVEIQNFGRRDKFDLHIVRYLLENAISLEKMKINYGNNVWKDTELRMSISEMILSYTMASSQAVIEFFGQE
ncbi:hypothetical protein ACHQM5_005488 [Ranunculus cassubicifolius]